MAQKSGIGTIKSPTIRVHGHGV